MRSKKSKRGIQAFNKARNPLYSGKRIQLWDDKVARFVESYLKLKEINLDDSPNSKVG